MLYMGEILHVRNSAPVIGNCILSAENNGLWWCWDSAGEGASPQSASVSPALLLPALSFSLIPVSLALRVCDGKSNKEETLSDSLHSQSAGRSHVLSLNHGESTKGANKSELLGRVFADTCDFPEVRKVFPGVNHICPTFIPVTVLPPVI